MNFRGRGLDRIYFGVYNLYMNAADPENSPKSFIKTLLIFINTAMVTGIILGITDCIGNYKWLLSRHDMVTGLTIVAIVIIASLFEALALVTIGILYGGTVVLTSSHLSRKVRALVVRIAVFIPVSAYILALGLALFSGKGLQRMGISHYLQAGFWVVGSAIVWLWLRRFRRNNTRLSTSVRLLLVLAFFALTWADMSLYRGLYQHVHILIGLAAGVFLFFAVMPVIYKFGQRTAPIRSLALALVFVAILGWGGSYLLFGDEGIQHDIIEESSFAGLPVSKVLQINRPVSGFSANMLSNHLAYDRHDPAVDALRGQSHLKTTPNILLVTVETTRFDHTSMGGYSRNTTPNLAAFARHALLFTNAYAAFPGTEYSMISMMTGLPINLMFRFSPRGNYLAFPELLDLAGYKTACYFPFREYFGQTPSGIYYFYHLFGCRETHEDSLPAGLLTDKLVSRVKAQGDRPLFIWAHYIDPHGPYKRHKAFDFGNRPIDRYDSEIAFTDDNLGRLLREIESRGTSWVVIIASDHGEEFGEHGHFGHASDLYEQQEHIMFMMRFPGVRAGIYTGPVCLTDVMPTILDFIGIHPPKSCVGSDILSLVAKKSFRNSIVASLDNKVMVRDRQWKMILNSSTGTRELYSMLPKPDEFKNLVGSRPKVAAHVFAELSGWMERLKQVAAMNKKSTKKNP